MVERYYGPLVGFDMRLGERGDYVRYSDYAALEAQLAEKEAENERLREINANLMGDDEDTPRLNKEPQP